MERSTAAIGSAIFFVLAPGIVAGVIPYWITRWQVLPLPYATPIRAAGAVLAVAGIAALIHAFARFVVEGLGTPAPVAPTEHLVVGGLYRYVRNPMYLAVLAVIIGQALVLGRPGLFLYAALLFAIVATFVRLYEEPTLRQRYGEEYEAYTRAVPAWWPRLRRTSNPIQPDRT